MTTTTSVLRVLGISCLLGLPAACGGQAFEETGGSGDGVTGVQSEPEPEAGESSTGTGGTSHSHGENTVAEPEPEPEPTPDPAPAGERASIALWGDQLPDPSEGSGTSGSTGGGGDFEHDPETLHIYTGTRAPSCTDPHAGSLPCNSWSLSFQLPPDLLEAGATVGLDDPRIVSLVMETGQNAGAPAGDCWWGGGTAFDGTLEVLEVRDEGVRYRLTDAVSLDGFDMSGTYFAAACAR